jgi:hypothetical protein
MLLGCIQISLSVEWGRAIIQTPRFVRPILSNGESYTRNPQRRQVAPPPCHFISPFLKQRPLSLFCSEF